MAWQHGVAKVVKNAGSKIVVLCPFCEQQHEHPKQSLGSREVVAGCHKGFARSYSYSIPDRRRV